MKISHTKQGTPEWFQERCGIPSASNFDKIITTKGQPSKQRTKYMYQLAGERLTGKKEETYQSYAMTRGIEMEEEARLVFEMDHKVEIKQVGFCTSDCGRYGFSPDGIVDGAGWEVKCPSLAVHVEYLLNKKLPTTYFQQVQGSLFVSGFEEWWFESYYPDMPSLELRVFPDVEFHTALKEQLDQFCDELDELTERLRGE